MIFIFSSISYSFAVASVALRKNDALDFDLCKILHSVLGSGGWPSNMMCFSL